MLAPLNGVVAAGIDNISTNGESYVTLWRWESGISNSGAGAPTTTQGEPSANSSNITATTTNETLPPTP